MDNAFRKGSSIKILAVGNSFSVDAMEHLYGILQNAGFREIVLGNLYIGGCSLDTHWNNFKNGSPDYIFYHTASGVWEQTREAAIVPCLQKEDWDVITLQQASYDSGRLESYGTLENLLNGLREKATNPNAEYHWHMTWAYQQNSDHDGFACYGADQMQMYRAITAAVRKKVEGVKGIRNIIPSGTAIQNLRTSYLGDTLTRDGFHLSYDIGRYTVALCWYAQMTGLRVESVTWVPERFSAEIRPHLPVIRAAVTAAIERPYAVTDCSRICALPD